jgi:hypothetical protein
MPFFADMSTFCLFAGIAILTWVFLRKTYRRRRKIAAPLPLNPSIPSSAQPLIDAPRELARWQVEMHQLARDLKAEVETKIGLLRHTAIMARCEADRLEKLLAETERQRAT